MFVSTSKFFPPCFYENDSSEEEVVAVAAKEVKDLSLYAKPIFSFQQPTISSRPLPPAPLTSDGQPFQPFTFPMEVWDVIIDRMDGNSWKALSQTCSILHSKVSYVAAEKLEIIPDDSASIEWKPAQTSTFMRKLRIPSNQKSLKKLWITQTLRCYTRLPLSPIISRIVRCDLKELKIQYNKLTYKEYQILTNSGSIEILSLEGVDILCSETNELVPIQDVLSRVTNAYDIYVQPCHTNFYTPISFRELTFKRKILKLALVDITIRVTSPAFFSFLMKNASPCVSVFLRICRDVENRFANNVMKRHFNAVFNDNKPQKRASLRFA